METPSSPATSSAIGSADLLRRCLRERSDADWRLFHDRFGDLLRRLLGRLVLRRVPRFDRDALDDALQDLYGRLLRYGGELLGASDRQLWGFLCRAAASVVVDTWRRMQRRTGFKEGACGLILTDESLREILWQRRARSPRWSEMLPCSIPPSAFLARSPEEILLQKEDALRLFLQLPRSRRLRWWRKNLRYLV